jgi:hypothetical protein
MDHDNQLSQQEFFVGLHLISKVREVCVTCSVRARQLLTRVTQGYDLPETTPAALVASASKVSYLTPAAQYSFDTCHSLHSARSHRPSPQRNPRVT